MKFLFLAPLVVLLIGHGFGAQAQALAMEMVDEVNAAIPKDEEVSLISTWKTPRPGRMILRMHKALFPESATRAAQQRASLQSGILIGTAYVMFFVVAWLVHL